MLAWSLQEHDAAPLEHVGLYVAAVAVLIQPWGGEEEAAVLPMLQRKDQKA